jgi:hypothetical protein
LHRLRIALMALALLLPGVVLAESTALPDGFPAALAVPPDTPVVFLTGSEQAVGSDGSLRPYARVCEFNRTDDHDARRLMDHYLAVFEAEGWQGSVTQSGSERTGSFETDGVEATVRLRPRASGEMAFTLRVRVLAQ